MAISEQSRHALHSRLEAVLGSDEAATLMEHLPPTTWGDVATKADLVLLRRDLDNAEQRLRSDFRADLHASINEAVSSQTRTIVLAVIGSNLTTAALAFAAATVR